MNSIDNHCDYFDNSFTYLFIIWDQITIINEV